MSKLYQDNWQNNKLSNIIIDLLLIFKGNEIHNYDPPKQTTTEFKYASNLTVVININHFPAGALNISIFLYFSFNFV